MTPLIFSIKSALVSFPSNLVSYLVRDRLQETVFNLFIRDFAHELPLLEASLPRSPLNLITLLLKRRDCRVAFRPFRSTSSVTVSRHRMYGQKMIGHRLKDILKLHDSIVHTVRAVAPFAPSNGRQIKDSHLLS